MWRWRGKTFLRLTLHRTCMVKRLVRASSLCQTPLLSVLQCSENSETSESLPPIMFWSQAAPCRFLHLAREKSSFTEGIVQAETPSPAQSSLFQLPCMKLHEEQPGCGLETERVLHSKAFFAAHLKVQVRRHSSSQAPPCLCSEAPGSSGSQGRQRKVGS